ncbi:MAG TPA: PLP-dependent aminotransferase family protein [Chloroflexota bacterium]
MELLLGVDPQSDAALHRQVYDGLRSAILNGRLRAGEKLPATRALAERLSLSRSTVTEAYDQLQAEGYIEGRHGSGTYVASNLPEEAHPPAPPPLRAEASPPIHLSQWGNRVLAQAPGRTGSATTPDGYRYDFRPHQVAQDVFPWEAWRVSVDRALGRGHETLFYSPAAGHPPLQAAIAQHVATHRGVICSPDQVAIVNGTQQGLNLLAELLLDSGDSVAVEDPGYPAARMALEARGLDVSRIPVDGDGMIVEQLSEWGPFRLIHVTPSHQDPTGATLSLARRLALLEEAERAQSVIVEDDYDSEFRYEGRPVESLQGLSGGENVVYAGTFSKSVLAGLRIGFLVLPRRLVAPFAAAKALWDSGAPMLEQVALVEFMRSGHFERHIRRMRRLYRARRDAIVKGLEDAFGDRARVGERHGGLNVLVTLSVPLAESEISARAARVGIGLRAAGGYYAHPPPEPTFLMGFGAMSEEGIHAGVCALAEAIGKA